VEAIRRAGVGQLYEAFLRLKEKLNAQGWFAAERKRAIPMFAKRIGIVTSLQAAALRDVLTALQRRAPHVHIVLYPAPVQGQGAGEKIAEAINMASQRAEVDVLIVCRGGGSIEDLWSFNEEVVALAIAQAAMPVISGVGHETDFTIADFAADLRAATPTAAAELAATAHADWYASLEADANDLTRAMQRKLAESNQGLDNLTRRLQNPASQLEQQRLRLAGAAQSLGRAMRVPLHRGQLGLAQWRARWSAQRPKLDTVRGQLASTHARARACLDKQLQARRALLGSLSAQLELLNPQRTLERGYAIVRDAKGQVLRSPAQIQPQDRLQLRLAEGSAELGVATVQPRLE
ncbi:MAG: exodeoxyribonuclease VII large subunit, partial [Pseudomonadota bacterium]